MTPRVAAAIAAGMLAIGILVGAAGAVVIRDATAPDMAQHMSQMAGMAEGMGQMAGMMSSMGRGASMGGGASMSPQDHASHHTQPAPGATP